MVLLNFIVTQEGLQDQMINMIIKIEEPGKDREREKNIKLYFQFKNKQQETEDKILKLLQDAKGNILDDDVLIKTLQDSKDESIRIEKKLVEIFKSYLYVVCKSNSSSFKNIMNRSDSMWAISTSWFKTWPSLKKSTSSLWTSWRNNLKFR